MKKMLERLAADADETLSAYAVPMEEGAQGRIKAMIQEKTQRKKAGTVRRRLRPVLIAAAAVLLLSVSAAAVNTAVDLTPLIEPILGEKAAAYVQGIQKTSIHDGLLLEVEAVYNDEENAYVFFTLTDTLAKGRIDENSAFDERFFNRVMVPYATYGHNDVRVIGYDAEIQQARFYTNLYGVHEKLGGKLVKLELSDLVNDTVETVKGTWSVTFRLNSNIKTTSYTLDEAFEGGIVETVEETPTRVRIKGYMDEPQALLSAGHDCSLITAAGEEMDDLDSTVSVPNEGPGSFEITLDGIIPEDLAAVRLWGHEFTLK